MKAEPFTVPLGGDVNGEADGDLDGGLLDLLELERLEVI